MYKTLVSKARNSQGPLLAQLGSMQSAGKVSRTESFWIINSIVVNGDLSSAQAIAASPAVAEVAELPDAQIVDIPGALSPQAQAVVEKALAEQKNQVGVGARSNPGVSFVIQPNLDAIRAPQAWSLGYDGADELSVADHRHERLLHRIAQWPEQWGVQLAGEGGKVAG